MFSSFFENHFCNDYIIRCHLLVRVGGIFFIPWRRNSSCRREAAVIISFNIIIFSNPPNNFISFFSVSSHFFQYYPLRCQNFFYIKGIKIYAFELLFRSLTIFGGHKKKMPTAFRLRALCCRCVWWLSNLYLGHFAVVPLAWARSTKSVVHEFFCCGYIDFIKK